MKPRPAGSSPLLVTSPRRPVNPPLQVASTRACNPRARLTAETVRPFHALTNNLLVEPAQDQLRQAHQRDGDDRVVVPNDCNYDGRDHYKQARANPYPPCPSVEAADSPGEHLGGQAVRGFSQQVLVQLPPRQDGLPDPVPLQNSTLRL